MTASLSRYDIDMLMAAVSPAERVASYTHGPTCEVRSCQPQWSPPTHADGAPVAGHTAQELCGLCRCKYEHRERN